ncbi:MAG: glycosyltransferase family 4 protein [Bacteroidales bacterium]
MSKTKICLVIPSLLPGGMERVMSELATYFSQTGSEVHLVLYGLKPSVFYFISSNIEVHIPNWAFDNAKRTWHTIKRMAYLRKEVKTIHPDVVLSFGEYWNNFGLLSLWGLNTPIFVSDRCQPDKSLGKLHDSMRKYLYPTAKGVVAQTSIAKEIYYKQSLNKNIRVIGNPIRSIDSTSCINSREKIVLSVGRLIESKHHDMLIDIFLQINLPEWKLVIVGGDALKENGYSRLMRKIVESGAEDRVVLTGNISNVDEYYLKSSIFAFTSSSEGFPNAIGEAMSAELSVVAFDCIAGPSDMIEDGKNGFLVPLFEKELFAQRLKFLMENGDMRMEMGKYAQSSMSRFTVEKIGREFYQFMTNGL